MNDIGSAARYIETPNLSIRIPHAKLVIFPDAGHGGIFQFHDEFVAEALGFLAS